VTPASTCSDSRRPPETYTNAELSDISNRRREQFCHPASTTDLMQLPGPWSEFRNPAGSAPNLS